MLSDTKKHRVLIVDDIEENIKILRLDVESMGYEVVSCENGKVALNLLLQDNRFDVILLDRMMPEMDGIEFLNRIKDYEELASIPIIMQTAADSHEQIKEGIDAGVFYYLTKPFSSDLMLALLKSAIDQKAEKISLNNEVSEIYSTVALLDYCQFRFQTLEEARTIAILLSNSHPNPQKIVVGLSEIMVNAVEHGNLDLGYETKKTLMLNYGWKKEIDSRLQEDEYKDRYATVSFKREDNKIIFRIQDEGEGFENEDFMEFSPSRAMDPNGRGIATAVSKIFDELHYQEGGNIVECISYINNQSNE